MIKRNQTYLNMLNAAADFLLVFFSYLFSAWFRLKVLNGWWDNKGLSGPMVAASAFYAVGLLFLLACFGFYSTTRVRKLTWKLSILFFSLTVSIFIVTALIFIFKVEDVSRGIILLFYFLTLFLLGTKQIVTRFLLNRLRSGGFNIRHELLIGTGKLAAQYRRDLADQPELGIKIDGILDPSQGPEVLERYLSSGDVDEVIMAPEIRDYACCREMINVCAERGVNCYLVPFYGDLLPAKPEVENIGRTKLVSLQPKRRKMQGGTVSEPKKDQRDAAKDQKKDVRVIVASHKPYWMPEDPLYVPLHTGAAGKQDPGFRNISCRGEHDGGMPREGFLTDSTGENISGKNENYCELTGLYWAWKNLKCDYLGLAHYRRHFTLQKGTNDRRDVLTLEQARELLNSTDVLLPVRRNYWIETNYQQYIHAHHAQDLDITREIISEKCPEYQAAFDKVMRKTTGHRFNMFIMKKELADAYCTWLFGILFELENRLDISDYSENDRRVFGFVSERLLDVWIDTNGISFRDIPYIFLDKQNWVTKIAGFLKRKLENGKAA